MAIRACSDPPATNPSVTLFIQAIVLEAATAADGVVKWLDAMGYRPDPKRPLVLDPGLLLLLGAASQLENWERAGLLVHQNRGLPSAAEVFEYALRVMGENSQRVDGSRLGLQVLKLFVREFAWSARQVLGAPVALGSLDEDAALDALAELLWNRRTEDWQG
jgi:hypothetical protein